MIIQIGKVADRTGEKGHTNLLLEGKLTITYAIKPAANILSFTIHKFTSHETEAVLYLAPQLK